MRNYWKMHYLKDLSDDAIRTMVERYETVPAPHTHVIVYSIGGGAVSRMSDEETAVSYHDLIDRRSGQRGWMFCRITEPRSLVDTVLRRVFSALMFPPAEASILKILGNRFTNSIGSDQAAIGIPAKTRPFVFNKLPPCPANMG